MHAAQLGRMERALTERGATAVVIGGGTTLATRLATRWLNLPYPILRDAGRAVYRAYGFDRMLGFYQQSGTVVVGADGTILFERQGANPQKALPQSEILAVLDRYTGRSR
jgi:peroxiredoxin